MKHIDAGSLRILLEAFAVGDALGMATEFMSRREIADSLGFVEGLVDREKSRNHPNLARGQVTDDTEQVLALLDEYCLRGRIDPGETAERLLRWVRESGAVEKRYIGPSSKGALEAIAAGADPGSTGMRGSTCGGVMRSPAAILFALSRGLPLEESIRSCLLPTHNTKPALEAAMAYGFALREALDGRPAGEVFEAALLGADAGALLAPSDFCSPSLAGRLRLFRRLSPDFREPAVVLEFLYDVYGTGLESADVASAALCIFFSAPDDPWLCLRMGASVGGDTDTIAALAGMLSAAARASSGRDHGIPGDVLREVLEVNRLDLPSLASRVVGDPSGGPVSGMKGKGAAAGPRVGS